MSRATLCLFALLLFTGGCDYREPIGRTSESGGCGDNGCDAAPTEENCDNFVIPVGDCTAGGNSCTFEIDCPASAASCSVATRRCFSDNDVCVGTPCDVDRDCAATERCNTASRSCYELSADQACMPCSFDLDCGTRICNLSTATCE